MRYKNYKSAIHNFAHSFQSIDYMKSGHLAVNVLIHLKNNGVDSTATFDFLNKTIYPETANYESSRQLLNDYVDWLPTHFKNHNCDVDKLQKLVVVISADFDKDVGFLKTTYRRHIAIKTKTFWKAAGKDEQTIQIAQDEYIADKFLTVGLPEFGQTQNAL